MTDLVRSLRSVFLDITAAAMMAYSICQTYSEVVYKFQLFVMSLVANSERSTEWQVGVSHVHNTETA